MEMPRHWRLRNQRYGLTGTICSECGKTFFTPRPVCDACASHDLTPVQPARRMSHTLAHAYEPAER
jgi:uncharacterized OB-fold protein